MVSGLGEIWKIPDRWISSITTIHYGLAGRGCCRKSAAVISPATVIASVLPVYLLMITGAVLRRTQVLPGEYDVPVMQLV